MNMNAIRIKRYKMQAICNKNTNKKFNNSRGIDINILFLDTVFHLVVQFIWLQ